MSTQLNQQLSRYKFSKLIECLQKTVLPFLLICAGDIELNLDSKRRDSCYNLSLFHLNLNSIVAHNLPGWKLIGSYNMKHNFCHFLSLSDISLFFHST